MFAIAAMAPGSLPRHRPFALFWLARTFSSFAYQMQAVAIGWQVYTLTNSPLALGMVGLAQYVPTISLVLLAGHVADRYDRRRIVAACQAVEAACAAILLAGAWHGWTRVEPLFGVILVLGAARAFESPTLAAMLPGLVGEGRMQQASAWSASSTQAATIAGPALGGLLYALASPLPFAAAALCFAAASLCVRAIPFAPATAREPPNWRSVFSGIAFIRGNPAVLGAISLDLFAVLLGGATALLPVYARDILQTGPWGLGVLRAAPAVGALLTSAALLHRPLRRHAGAVMFGAVVVYGAATIVFGLSRSLGLSLAALAVLGCADVVSVVIRVSLVQIRTPDAMRGRVSAVNSLFIGTSNQLGEFESGVTAALFGAVPAVMIGGVGTIAIAMLWMRFFPALRRVDGLD